MMPCVRAARMSWTAPGSAGEDHSSRPARSAITCTCMPCLLCLPEQKGRSAAVRSIGSTHRAVEDHESLGGRGLHRLSEGGCECGQNVDGLGDVPVGGGGAHAEPGDELGIGVTAPQTGQNQQRPRRAPARAYLARGRTPAVGVSW